MHWNSGSEASRYLIRRPRLSGSVSVSVRLLRFEHGSVADVFFRPVEGARSDEPDDVDGVDHRHGRRVDGAVGVAVTGREAVKLSEQITPALVVLDLGLPDIDGYAVIDAMRQHPGLQSVPLIVYTGTELDEADRQRLRLGETRFLAKGRITPDEFERQVLAVLDRIVVGAAR